MPELIDPYLLLDYYIILSTLRLKNGTIPRGEKRTACGMFCTLSTLGSV
jgi:hypothetical protein